MKNEANIVYEAPIIFTKDKDWIKNYAPIIDLKPGAIIALPADAICYIPPTVISVEVQDEATQ